MVPRWWVCFVDGASVGGDSKSVTRRVRGLAALKSKLIDSHSDTSASTTSSVTWGCWSSARLLADNALTAVCGVKPVPRATAQSSIAGRKSLMNSP